ncbi:uncharacterized protein [Palaemon carinicauda]|uniref:uncharacterized protein n=1 Tax=Palaemon carinicauda TaxID=392227 RepID=UPI0035B63053
MLVRSIVANPERTWCWLRTLLTFDALLLKTARWRDEQPVSSRWRVRLRQASFSCCDGNRGRWYEPYLQHWQDVVDEGSTASAVPEPVVETRAVRENLKPIGKGILPRQDIKPEEDLYARPFYEVCSYDKIYKPPDIPVTKETAKGFIAKIREKEDSRECQGGTTNPELKRKAATASQFDSYDEIDPFDPPYVDSGLPLLEEIEKISCTTVHGSQNLGVDRVVSPVLGYSESNSTSPQRQCSLDLRNKSPKLELTLDSRNKSPQLESTSDPQNISPQLEHKLGSQNTSPELDRTLCSQNILPPLDHSSGSLNKSPQQSENLHPEETTTEARSLPLHSPQTNYSYITPAANTPPIVIIQAVSSSGLRIEKVSSLPSAPSYSSSTKLRPIRPVSRQTATVSPDGQVSIGLPSSSQVMTRNVTGQRNQFVLLTNSVGSATPGAGPSSVWVEASSATRGKRTSSRILQMNPAPMSSDAQAITDKVTNPSSNLGETSATRDLINKSNSPTSSNSSASFSPIESTHGDGEQYKCQICDFSSDDKQKYIEHLTTHESNLRLRCKICGKTYYSSDTLRRHLSGVHKIDRKGLMTKEIYYNCKFCSEKFNLGLHYIKHLKAHIIENPHKCNKCSCSFDNVSELRQHKIGAHK